MPDTLPIHRKIYRLLLPRSVRNSRLVANLKSRLFEHDWTYSLEYYEKFVEEPAVRSAGTIADSIVNEFKQGSIIDVGCGTGALLEVLRNKGCEAFGLDYSEAALKFCRSRHLSVAKFDLEGDALDLGRVYDVAVSMEVAEHLPRKVADRYVDFLTRLSPVVIFTAAQPGQGGADHVNEQPLSYWIAKFRTRGFTHLDSVSQRWRETWEAAGNVESWYFKNLMIFRKAGSMSAGNREP